MKKSLASAGVIACALGTSAFAAGDLPFEQPQFDRGLPAGHDWAANAYQKGLPQGSAAGATSQPGSHHNVQGPARASAGVALREGNKVAGRRATPQPVPDPYTPQ